MFGFGFFFFFLKKSGLILLKDALLFINLVLWYLVFGTLWHNDFSILL
jgi:hypothetical protein